MNYIVAVVNQEQNKSGGLYRWAVWLSVFVFLARPGELFPVLASIHLGLLSYLFVAGAFFFTNGIGQVEWKGPQKIMLFWLFWGAVAIPFSVWPSYAFEQWWTVLFINVSLFFFWLPIVCRQDQLITFIRAVVLGIACLVILMLTGEVGEGRVSVGYMYDPNDMAMILVTVCPLVLYLFLQTSGLLYKLLWGGLFSAVVLAVLKTGSRGGILALAVALLVLLFRSGKDLRMWHRGMVVALAILFFMSPAADTVKDRWKDVLSGEDYNIAQVEEGGGGRLSLWLSAVQLAAKRPIFGVGVKNSQTALGEEYGEWRTVHNSFLEMLLDLGLPGLVLFSLLLRNIWQSSTRTKIDGGATLSVVSFLKFCLRIALVAYLFSAFFLSQAYSILLPLLLLISYGIQKTEVS